MLSHCSHISQITTGIHVGSGSQLLSEIGPRMLVNTGILYVHECLYFSVYVPRDLEEKRKCAAI